MVRKRFDFDRFSTLKNNVFFSGLANRGLGGLETAQDDKVEAEVRLRALDEGNHFYADSSYSSDKTKHSYRYFCSVF